MRKEVLPEQLNYNKFPGPHFLHFGDVVKSEDGQIVFKLVHNEKEAFNAESFEQRFSELLLKYDYLVGDWSSEQLRLRGFYKDKHNVQKLSHLSRLDDYLKEYCAFGCAYFILANENPVEMTFQEEKLPKRRKSRKRRSLKGPQGDAKGRKDTEPTKQNSRQKNKPRQEQGTVTNEHFSSRKRDSKNKQQKRDRLSKLESSSGSQHFTIRQKR